MLFINDREVKSITILEVMTEVIVFFFSESGNIMEDGVEASFLETKMAPFLYMFLQQQEV